MASSVHELTRQSGFVFEGTVRQLGASSSPQFPATPDSTVVQVDRILRGPPVFANLTGRPVTVILPEGDELAEGTRAVFFTNGVHYGGGIVVRSVGQSAPDDAKVAREVAEGMRQAEDDALLERLRGASFVLTGEVVSAAPFEGEPGGGSEHDPDWWEVRIDVESVEKGSVKSVRGKAQRFRALFAHSRDIAWYRSPKLKPGDRGVFVLHEGEFRRYRAPAPAVIDALDFQPLSEHGRIRDLIARLG